MFPLKAGMHSFFIDYKLPLLKKTSGNEKYTLLLEAHLKGANKKKKLDVSITLQVIDSQNMFSTSPTQVFETPLELVLLREKGEKPRIVEDTINYYLSGDMLQKIGKIFATPGSSHEINWLRAMYDAGGHIEVGYVRLLF